MKILISHFWDNKLDKSIISFAGTFADYIKSLADVDSEHTYIEEDGKRLLSSETYRCLDNVGTEYKVTYSYKYTSKGSVLSVSPRVQICEDGVSWKHLVDLPVSYLLKCLNRLDALSTSEDVARWHSDIYEFVGKD